MALGEAVVGCSWTTGPPSSARSLLTRGASEAGLHDPGPSISHLHGRTGVSKEKTHPCGCDGFPGSPHRPSGFLGWAPSKKLRAKMKCLVVGVLCKIGFFCELQVPPCMKTWVYHRQHTRVCHGFQVSHRLQSTRRTFPAKPKQGPCPIKVLLGPALLLTQHLLIQPEIGKTAACGKRFLASQQPQGESDSYCSCQEGLEDGHC